jgi:YVTN family beta-propeller protein
MYVANAGDGSVSVINTASNVVINTVAVDPSHPLPNRTVDPVALAEMPNASKIYSANHGNNTVTSINTVDGSIAQVIGLSASPIWAVASADNAFIYVLDAGGVISVIDTLSDTVVSSASAGPGANFLLYDKAASRLYVTNPAAATLSIFDTSGNALLQRSGSPVQIPSASSSTCTSAPQPASVTVLGDGSRAYVASYQADPASPNPVCTQVSVIDTGTSAVSKTISLGPAANASTQTGCASARFRVFTASSAGGANANFKVYVSQCDAGAVAVIDTFAVGTGADPHGSDVVIANLPSPVSSLPPVQLSILSASQAGGITTYSYSPGSGSGLQLGTSIVITGMTDAGNNGNFLVSGLATPTTFTVSNSFGVTTTTPQTGSALAQTLQNPVFLVPGP